MKKPFSLLLALLLFASLAWSQVSQDEIARIRQQMAKIRQSTDWNDPAAAKKANEEIQKLAGQISGQSPANTSQSSTPKSGNTKPGEFIVKTAITGENIAAIADRFYKRSYKVLDPTSKFRFDQDMKEAEKAKFSYQAVRKLCNIGASFTAFGNDYNVACVYITSAVKALPADTLSINNFGGYLRILDSVEVSVPVLLYANKLYSASPVILTQLGNSYFELNDLANAESYYKQAIKCNPDFGQAHSALCDLYIKQNRLQDAIVELFAGVKGMGCSYGTASANYNYLQQQAENSDTKSAFLDETKKQMDPLDDLGPLAPLEPLVPEVERIKMPGFPDCEKVEDWMEGGGYAGAVQAYATFHSSLILFVEKFRNVHSQLPSMPPNATLRDYPNERFALDCITEMFFLYSKEESDKYEKSVDEITQRVNDAKEIYVKNLLAYSESYTSCVYGCSGDDYCLQECHRVYCSKECPSANKFNDLLQNSYNDYRTAFSGMVANQIKLLDDLYAFTGQWYGRIYSPYWSKIYDFEIQRVALSIIANCYGAYPQAFQFPAHNDCGTDCSLFAKPYPKRPDEVAKKDPNGTECSDNSKHVLHLFFCEAALTCEYFELGCTEGVSASVRRNFGKNKSTSIFLGVGVKAGLGTANFDAKFGGQITLGDNGSVDGGIRGSASGSSAISNNGYNGADAEYNLTVMGGLNAETSKVSSKGYSPKNVNSK